MNLLLDTHVLLWWLTDPASLSQQAQAAIASGENLVFVSAASVWEMTIKSGLGKLTMPNDLDQQMQIERFDELPIRIADARLVATLPALHRDPFDRMLVAQARNNSLILVTRDRLILAYGGKMLRA